MKVQFFLSSMFQNHSITLAEFFHWLTCNNLTKCWFILFKIDLLTLPSSLLERFIRREYKLDWKLSLWSFKVIKAGVLARHSILSLSWIFFRCFSSLNYIFHNFKFQVCLRSSGEQRCYKYFLKILKHHNRYC